MPLADPPIHRTPQHSGSNHQQGHLCKAPARVTRKPHDEASLGRCTKRLGSSRTPRRSTRRRSVARLTRASGTQLSIQSSGITPPTARPYVGGSPCLMNFGKVDCYFACASCSLETSAASPWSSALVRFDEFKRRGYVRAFRSRRRSDTSTITRSAATVSSSCSHTRTTAHPRESRQASVSRSRATVRSNFAHHHSAFALGKVPCSAQWCQKQPSTNTATRA